jgi:serine O-acetyltransferase
MRKIQKNSNIEKIAEQLVKSEFIKTLSLERRIDKSLPDVEKIKQIIYLLKQCIFPEFFGSSPKYISLKSKIENILDKVLALLIEQIYCGLCIECSESLCNRCNEEAEKSALALIEALPTIQNMLLKDVDAIYKGDPASKSPKEVILCYPGINAILNYRIAHELYKMNIPIIPRIITEIAHSETGIDIHPGAQIGEYFAIDHGTGIVIGETAIIGNNVKIYQGVTLGAKSFPLDENGNPIKGIPRHPIVEDCVIIYSEATILGRVTIGHHSIIGANQWITTDIPPYTKLTVNI